VTDEQEFDFLFFFFIFQTISSLFIILAIDYFPINKAGYMVCDSPHNEHNVYAHGASKGIFFQA